MGRKKGDGLGRFGGRQKGTPNKSTYEFKLLLKSHSERYFQRTQVAGDVDFFKTADGMLLGFEADTPVSQFEIDLVQMKATDRAKVEVELLNYHSPKMSAIAADMSLREANQDLASRLVQLSNGEDVEEDVSDTE